MAITHAHVNPIPDDPAATAAGEVTPTRWNADHIGTIDYSDLTGTPTLDPLTITQYAELGAGPYSATGLLRLSQSGVGPVITARSADDSRDLVVVYLDSDYIEFGDPVIYTNADAGLQQVPNTPGLTGGSVFFASGHGADAAASNLDGANGGPLTFASGIGSNGFDNGIDPAQGGNGGSYTFGTGAGGTGINGGNGGRGGNLTIIADHGGNSDTGVGGNGGSLTISAGNPGTGGGGNGAPGTIEVDGPLTFFPNSGTQTQDLLQVYDTSYAIKFSMAPGGAFRLPGLPTTDPMDGTSTLWMDTTGGLNILKVGT